MGGPSGWPQLGGRPPLALLLRALLDAERLRVRRPALRHRRVAALGTNIVAHRSRSGTYSVDLSPRLPPPGRSPVQSSPAAHLRRRRFRARSTSDRHGSGDVARGGRALSLVSEAIRREATGAQHSLHRPRRDECLHAGSRHARRRRRFPAKHGLDRSRSRHAGDALDSGSARRASSSSRLFTCGRRGSPRGTPKRFSAY